MAECSYARCLLERRLIKRELMRWSKDVLHIVGLERIAEELMGRRKWKHFQEVQTRSHMNTEKTTILKLNNLKENVEHDPVDTFGIKNRSLSTDTLEEGQQDPQRQQQTCEEEENEKEHSKAHHNGEEIKVDNNSNTENSTDNLTTTTTSHNQTTEHNNNKNNNNNINNNNNNISGDCTTDIGSQINDITNRSNNDQSEIVKSPIEPIDWKPDEKCNFCINGKLLTVNDKGELVAESGPAMSEADAQRLDTDSDSDESSNIAGGGSISDNSHLNLTKLLTSRQRDFPANMASINSLPHLATMQSLSGQYFQNLNWLQTLQTSHQLNTATSTTSDISATAISPSLKDSPSPSDVTGEQPLDLSSKPSPNSSTGGDLKAVRPKSSRSTPISSGRRTYSEEDLNNALQDILSGKLGTRKAAVRYSVPRSTLRNKMSKHTQDGNRIGAQASNEILETENSDEDGDGDGEGDADSSTSTQQPNDGQLNLDDISSVVLRKLSEINGKLNVNVSDVDVDARHSNSKSNNTNKIQSSTPPIAATEVMSGQGSLPSPMIDKTALLSALLLLSNFGGLDDTITLRDLFSALIVNPNANPKTTELGATAGSDSVAENSALNNGKGVNMVAQRLLLQQLQQDPQQQRTSPFTSHLTTSDTPETNSSLDPSENFDDPTSILKIPSYKPVAGSSNTREPSVSPALSNNTNSNLHRNGDSPHSVPSPRTATSMLAATVTGNNSNMAASRQGNLSVISPPLPSHHSLGSTDSQSPPSFSLRDVIASSIQRTMSEQAKEAAAASMLGLANDVERSNAGSSNDYKKPSISVVKNLGGTDTSRFASAPNLLTVVGGGSTHSPLHHNHQSQFHMPHHSHHSAHQLSRQEAAALAAGKGTRPKRGKYRNYDRDSLVEAVKAVQRGEMSVHRAGSYYGVPHSTLEYKVKERHLMRPRKREPKPQPGIDGASSSSNAASSSKTNSHIPGLSNLDKMKASGSGSSSNMKLNNALKNNGSAVPTYGATGPNGIKLNIFDSPVAAQFQYPANLFWQHPSAAFSQLQMDFNRNAASAANASVNSALLQRYKEDTTRPACENVPVSTNRPSPTASPINNQNQHPLAIKSTRDLAENLYESGATNGSSFLDGLIRKTLDRKSMDISPHATANVNSCGGSSGALLDQLVKKSPLPFTNNRTNELAASAATTSSNYGPTFLAGIKRSSSPPAFPGIKRERTTPPPPLLPSASSDDEEQPQRINIDDPNLIEHNNNNNNNSSSKGKVHGNGRTNHGSDSESDTAAHHFPHNTHSNHQNTKLEDINGDSAVTPKSKQTTPVPQPQPPPPPHLLTNAITGPPTSILQEKLAQIKAEQEHEVDL